VLLIVKVSSGTFVRSARHSFKGLDGTLQTAKLKLFQRSRVTAHSDKGSGRFRGSLRYSHKDKFNR
jgi:hypothetical protein